MSTTEKRIKQYCRHDFQFHPLFELGIASNCVNIKNRYGRFVGSIEAKDIPAFKAMGKGKTPDSFKPSSDWRLTFSIKLMDELGLAL